MRLSLSLHAEQSFESIERKRNMGFSRFRIGISSVGMNSWIECMDLTFITCSEYLPCICSYQNHDQHHSVFPVVHLLIILDCCNK